MKGFIFSASSVELILAGSKTQTRRVVNPQPVGAERVYFHEASRREPARFEFLKEHKRNFVISEDHVAKVRPRLLFDEVFYVKESLFRSKFWFPGAEPDARADGFFYGYKARMTESERWLAQIKPGVEDVNPRNVGEVSARVFLRCRAVTCERLHKISADDIKAEIGFPTGVAAYGKLFWLEEFRGSWDRVNRDHRWEQNPWVFVYSFALEKVGACQVNTAQAS